MAEVRVMLSFDYAPPTQPDTRQLWMLVSLERLRTVSDLSALIRDRYYQGHTGAASLYLHGVLLPPGESVRLLRDDDRLRVLWTAYDPGEDDPDHESQARPSRKRSRQRCEEDAEDGSAVKAQKRRWKQQGEETPRSRKETSDEKDTEQVKSSERPRKRSKKRKKRVPEERPEETFTEESTERKSKKPSPDLAPPKAAKKIQNSLTPNHESPAKRESSKSASTSHHSKPSKSSRHNSEPSPDHKPSTKGKRAPKATSVHKTKPSRDLPAENANRDSPSDLSSSSDQESSTTRKRPPKAANKAGAKDSVMKTKPNHGSSAPNVGSSSDSSSDQESSTTRKRPPKAANKAGAKDSVTKTKPNHGSSAPNVGSSSDSSSDQESSTIQKKPPKVTNKAGANDSVTKAKPNHSSLVPKVGSNSDSSSDQESTIQKKPPKVANKAGANISVPKAKPNQGSSAPNVGSSSDSSSSDQELSTATKSSINPFNPIYGRERRNDVSASDNGDPIKSGGAVTSLLLNGTSQTPSQGIPSPGCDLGSKQEPGTSQRTSSVANGRENGGIQQQCYPGPGPYDHGRGRGTFPWMGQVGRGFRGQGRGIPPWRGQEGRRFRGEPRRGPGYNNQFFHSYDSPTLKKQQLEEPAANVSVIIQNPAEIPKRDYDALPQLAAPPQAGAVIAFKILELNENYSPELSDYKEGVVRSYDAVTQQIEVELLAQQKKREPGKFDLVYESEDGTEMVEYAVLPDCKVVEVWTSLVSPRLVMAKGSQEGI